MTSMHHSGEQLKKKNDSSGGIARCALVLACGGLIVGHCANLHAQSALITHGPFSFEPLIDVELSYDDNIFRSAVDEVDSSVMRLAPVLNSVIDSDSQVYTFTYTGDYGFYANSGDDNYDDHEFYAEADLNLNYRNHLNIAATYLIGHQDRGTGITEGIDPNDPVIDSPIRLNTAGVDAEYTLGSTESTNRIVLAGLYRDIQYQNHRELTRYQDRDRARAGATYYYRVSSATSLLAEIIADNVSYNLNQPGTATLDSKLARYRVGATWDITEQTSGTIKLGYQNRKFDDDAREDFSSFDWDVVLRWSPRSYSHIDLVSSRPPEEAYGIANFKDTKLYGAAWTHEWTERLETKLGAAYKEEVFEGTIREEDTYIYDFALTHQWRRWLSFELGASYEDRDSTIDRLVFNRTVFWLGASFSL